MRANNEQGFAYTPFQRRYRTATYHLQKHQFPTWYQGTEKRRSSFPSLFISDTRGVEREFTSSAFGHAKKDAREDQSMVLARVIASFMNTDGGTLYIGVNDKRISYRNPRRPEAGTQRLRYLSAHSKPILSAYWVKGKKIITAIRNTYVATFKNTAKSTACTGFQCAPINEVVKVSGKIYTRSGSSCHLQTGTKYP